MRFADESGGVRVGATVRRTVGCAVGVAGRRVGTGVTAPGVGVRVRVAVANRDGVRDGVNVAVAV